MPETRYEALAQELVVLGRALPDPAPEAGLAVGVMERIADLPAPVAASRWTLVLARIAGGLARHRRGAMAVIVALLLSLLAAPPVRAAVADWFGFGGVIVHHDSTRGPASAPPPPTVATSTELEKARQLVSFTPSSPEALGPPRGVEVSADRRVLSMSWTTAAAGPVRLDEFDARLDYAFAKSAHRVEFVTVDGDFALWFDEPHNVVLLNADGTKRTESARLAGNTLIWVQGTTTLRLEGKLSRVRAIEIAESASELR